MTTKQWALDNIGEVLLTGIDGLTLSDDTSAFLSQAKIGGVLLFARNYDSPTQVKELIDSIQAQKPVGSDPLWISVDHEGGKVQRFKKGFTLIPEAMDLAELDSPKIIFDLSEMIAQELRAVGININFAPVADIHSNDKNPVIGRRAFGTDPEQVGKLVSAFVRGHLKAGVNPCLKHFPGHGDTTQDSHFEMATSNSTLEEHQNREWIPFQKGIRAGCRMIMTAHLKNPNLDSENPATLSTTILRKYLREDLRYTGIIVSDDLEMHAITNHYKAEESPVLAIAAGCDLIIYRTEGAARKGYKALVDAIESGGLPVEAAIEAIERCKHWKKDFFQSQTEAPAGNLEALVGTKENAEKIQNLKLPKSR